MSRLNNLLSELRDLEVKVAEEISHEAEGFGYTINKGRVKFEAETRKQHVRLSKTIRAFLGECSVFSLAVSPLVYSLIIPLVIFDVFLLFYQAICFSVYGIPKVKRADYIALDRHQLKYLNMIERFNCVYCSYANGFIAYAQEVAARSEQYWCPIKHARQLKATHSRYNKFTPYGDSESYLERVQALRDQVTEKVNNQ
jgi:hypothetical protein